MSPTKKKANEFYNQLGLCRGGGRFPIPRKKTVGRNFGSEKQVDTNSSAKHNRRVQGERLIISRANSVTRKGKTD